MPHKNPEFERLRKINAVGYDERYDAYYNKMTREWLEEACDSPECTFCHGRPPKYQSEGDALLDRIEALHEELKRLQDGCPHEHAFEVHHSEDGYAEPTRYFTDFICKRCGKKWTKEGTWN